MMQPKSPFRKLAIGAAALAMLGVSVSLTAAPVWAVERDAFKDECEAGGGTFSEKTVTLYCDHKIQGGDDDGKTITTFCSKTSNDCSTTVNRRAPSRRIESVAQPRSAVR